MTSLNNSSKWKALSMGISREIPIEGFQAWFNESCLILKMALKKTKAHKNELSTVARILFLRN